MVAGSRVSRDRSVVVGLAARRSSLRGARYTARATAHCGGDNMHATRSTSGATSDDRQPHPSSTRQPGAAAVGQPGRGDACDDLVHGDDGHAKCGGGTECRGLSELGDQCLSRHFDPGRRDDGAGQGTAGCAQGDGDRWFCGDGRWRNFSNCSLHLFDSRGPRAARPG